MDYSTVAAGPDRTRAVLDKGFLEGLKALEVEELRRRRDAALAEREYQSYLRRLLQARRDLLVAERERRDSGVAAAPLVERLKEVLSAGPQGAGRGEAVRVALPEADVLEAEARANAIVGQVSLVDPQNLEDSALEEAIEALEEEEREVSAVRAAVIQVHDRFQDELKRRYREDPAAIPSGP